jgi:cytoskeleton protein RodZ
MSDVEQDKQENPTEESTVVSGPGRRLREAREARKLSLEQVAAQLRMKVDTIAALESDDYSSLPGNTFVQGYLRSYSRLLGLPEESVVALARSGNIEEPRLVSTISEGKIETSSRDLPIRMTNILIVIIVIAGLGWWLSQRTPVIDSRAPQQVVPGAGQGLLLPEEEVQQQSGEESAVSEGEAVPEEATTGDTEPQAEESVSSEPVKDETPVVETSPEVIVTPAATTVAATLSPETPQSELIVDFTADSWSEIKDAAGRKLAYGLVPAGSHLTLRGEAPFKLFLGYARGVTVYYNGDLYDHTAYHRGDVAGFRIGRAEHNRPLSGN